MRYENASRGHGIKGRYLTDLEEVEKRKNIEPVDFRPGSAHEQRSAERQRRKTVTGQLGYQGAAAASGTAATAAAGAKLAGTRIGQASLKGWETSYRAGKQTEAADAVKDIARAGQWARRNHKTASALTLGGTAVAALAGTASRVRANEESGMSQSIGRMKGGTKYRRDLADIKKNFRAMAALAAEVDRGSPNILRARKVLNEHGGKIVAGGTGAAGGATLVATGVSRKRRKRDQAEVRSAMAKRDGDNKRLAQGALGGAAIGTGVAAAENTIGDAIYRSHGLEPNKLTRSLNRGNLAIGAGIGSAFGLQRAHSKNKRRKQAQQQGVIKAAPTGHPKDVLVYVGAKGSRMRQRNKIPISPELRRSMNTSAEGRQTLQWAEDPLTRPTMPRRGRAVAAGNTRARQVSQWNKSKSKDKFDRYDVPNAGTRWAPKVDRRTQPLEKREPLKTSISEQDAERMVRRHGLKGPLPKGLTREQKMAAYEARYVSAGGRKSEKWDRKARGADKVKNAGLGVATMGGTAWLASRGKQYRSLSAIKATPRREHAENLAAAGAVVGGGAELYAGHARRKRSSYASAPGGVAASALRRMQDNTP